MNEYMKAAELVKKIAEMKKRQAAASDAVAKAQKRIAARGQFVPKTTRPCGPVVVRF